MLGTELNPREYLHRCAAEFERLDLKQIEGLADDIFAAYQQGKFVFICGNGGSGSNSSHFCEDLGKSTLRREDFTKEGGLSACFIKKMFPNRNEFKRLVESGKVQE